MKKDTLVKEGFFSRFLVMLVLIAALALLPGLLPTGEAYAADIVASGTCGAQGDNLTWTLDSDGLLTISGTGEMADYSSNNMPWHSYRGSITSVVFEDGVTSIDSNAFYGCTSLTSVTIPNTVTSIGDYAFQSCRSLTSVPIPDSVTSIGDYTFGYCTGLTSVTIPGSVSNIGKCAFRACENLVTADICEGVTQIYSGMFSECSNLTCLNIPSTVTSIDEQAFDSCFNLTEIIIDNANPCYSAEGCAVFDKNKETLFFCTQAVTGAYSVPDGVTAIGKNAFAWNDNLTSVTIPASMAIISDNAFEGCHALADMYYKGTLEQWIILDKGNLDETLPDLNLHFGGSTYFAVGTCGDSLTWTLDSDGVLTISGSGYMYDYIFPMIQPEPVENGNEAPWALYRSEIEKIEISDGVLSIGQWAFVSCSNLTSVTIPDSVTSIGEGAFGACSSLASVTIPDSVTSIEYIAFGACTSLTSVTIPDSVTNIGKEAFEYCSSLTSVTIPGSVTSIEDLAFAYCESLISVTIPDSVISIGDDAFYNCTSLTEVTIPDSVASIGNSAFEECRSLTGVTIPASVTRIGEYAFKECRSLTEITIPGSVENISSSAFSGCEGLISVTIGNGVTSIGDWAFANCDSLTSVTIPDSVASIGNNAFEYCDSLSDVYYGGTEEQWNTITIGNNNDPLTNAHFHFREIVASGTCGAQGDNLIWTLDNNGLLTISGTGEMNDYVSSAQMPGGYIIQVKPWSRNANNIKSVAILDGVTSIGDGAFYSFSTLSSVTIADSVTSIGRYAFSYCSSLTSVTIPDSVTSIGSNAFSGCSNLTSVTIPDSVTSIGDEAFVYCESLPGVTIGNGVTSIGNYAFSGCDSLTGVTIPDSVESIGEGAFADCDNLTEINIGKSVSSIGKVAFDRSYSLTDINVDSENDHYSSQNGVLFNKDQTELIFCPRGKSGAYVIPDMVEIIGLNAFANCNGLTEVMIPDSVTSIRDYAFESCTSLTSVTIPESVTSIGDGAFAYCTSLTSVTIGNSVTSIGDEAFVYCESLTSVTIPDSVTAIGDAAFGACSSLTNFDVASDNAHYSSLDGVLFNKTKTELICCPGGKEGAYSIPASVTGIGDYAFAYCESLTNVTIPDSVTAIGDGAFGACSSLTSVTIPDSVTSIGEYAFYGCSSLTSVTIPDSVTSIGEYAFDSCETLADVYYRGTEDQWNMLDIGEGNELLLDATIHFREIIDSGSCGENLTWELDSFGVLTISGTGAMADYSYSSHAPWYSKRGSIGTVVIEDGITCLGAWAFYNCSSLTSVTIPDSIAIIGEDVFYNCSNLTSVTIPDSVTSIGAYAFQYCGSLTSVTIPVGVTSIGYRAFFNCSSLAGIVIPEGICEIRGQTFAGCSNMTAVIIPNSVTSIGDHAFGGCSSLTSVTIPASVISMESEVFDSCSGLTSAGPIGSDCNIVFGWTAIPAYAFSGCSSLTSVTIPDSVTNIGYDAFAGCSSLTSVTFTDWLFYSERSAGSVFDNCPNLTVYGYSGTWLEGWLANSGINFSPLDTAPNWIDGEYAQPSLNPRTTMHITSAEDLAWLAQYVNAGHTMASFTVLLEADIDLSGKLWTPIGTDETSFGGVFDGQGHTISGMTISMYGGSAGLFKYLANSDSGAGRICNLCLANAKIIASWDIYPIACYDTWKGSVITNCGAWGWASNKPYLYSDLAWSSFDTPNGNYSRIYSYQKGINGSVVTADYLRSAEFLEWINSYPGSSMYDWVSDADGSNNGFPRMSTEPALRNWVDVAETVAAQNNVYDIYNPQQLGYIANLVNGGNALSGKTVRLQADLDLSAYYWTPMSTLTADFDGNGHSITGLKVGNADFPCRKNAGLIGTMNGNVTSLTIAGDVISSSFAGMIAGDTGGSITDCHGSGSVTGVSRVGGIVGYADWTGPIYACSFSGTVSAPSGEGHNYCGGIVGDGGVIEQCSFSGLASGSTVGGIAGSGAYSVLHSSAVGTLTGNTVGGICGFGGSSQIENCYSICDITGSSSAGGLIGELGGRVTVRNCYAGGSVGGAGNIGALFGDLNDNSNNTYENVYWNQDGGYTLDGLSVEPWACGNGEELDGVTALTAEQMRQQSSFVGFDFATVWAIDASTNDGMPYLRQEEAEYIPGDVNGDGKINNKDVTRLMRYIKYHDVDVEEAALDVNGDGVVNNKDVTRLMRYIKYGDVDIF